MEQDFIPSENEGSIYRIGAKLGLQKLFLSQSLPMKHEYFQPRFLVDVLHQVADVCPGVAIRQAVI